MADSDVEPASADSWRCTTCQRSYPNEFALCPVDATPRGGAASVDPLIGAVLGQTYRIASVLGEGGMARLYRAEHVRIDEAYAVKIIHDELAAESVLQARFEREARAAGSIHSPHVIRLVDVLRTPDDRPCIVTELLHGEDLGARLKRVPKLGVAEAIPIARQLCRGVAAAHAVGVVHRDLKPPNVFLCDADPGAPLVKIVDFGIAKVEDDEDLTQHGAVMGTAAYMPPEQALRPANAGPPADVYAIGAILYHMLTGEPPYGNVPPVSRFALLLQTEPARPRSLEPSIPEGLEAVIQHAMAREPDARVPSALDLEQQLAVFDTASLALAPGPPGFAMTETAVHAIALRARLARPTAVVVAIASALAAGAWAAAMLGALLAPTTHGERVLLAVIGFGATIGIGALHVRRLRDAWESTPAIGRYIAPFTRALIAGMTALGVVELATFGWAAVMHGEPLRPTLRLVIAAGVAVLGLAWRTWGLDRRLRGEVR